MHRAHSRQVHYAQSTQPVGTLCTEHTAGRYIMHRAHSQQVHYVKSIQPVGTLCTEHTASRYQMDMNRLLNVTTALPAGKESPVPTKQGVGWGAQPLWAFGEGTNLLALPGIGQFLSCPAHSMVTTLILLHIYIMKIRQQCKSDRIGMVELALQTFQRYPQHCFPLL